MNVMTSYKRLEKTDREDYMKLYNLHSFMNSLDEKKTQPGITVAFQTTQRKKKP